MKFPFLGPRFGGLLFGRNGVPSCRVSIPSAKAGDKVRKELDTKGDKAGNEKRPGYVWTQTRQAKVIAENTQLMCLLRQAWQRA
jgi:hypothetical protein